MSDSSGDEYLPVVNEPMAENNENNPVKTISEKVFSIMDPNNTSCYNFVECFKIQFKRECVAVEQPTLLFRADTPGFEVKLGDYSNVFTNENFREGNLYHLSIDLIHHIVFYRDGDNIVVMQAHQAVYDDSKTERTKHVSEMNIDFFIDILNGFIQEDITNEKFKQSYLLLTGIHLPFDDLRYIVGKKAGSKHEIIKGISVLKLHTLTLDSNLGERPKIKTKKTKKSKKRKTKKTRKRKTKKSTKKKRKRRNK